MEPRVDRALVRLAALAIGVTGGLACAQPLDPTGPGPPPPSPPPAEGPPAAPPNFPAPPPASSAIAPISASPAISGATALVASTPRATPPPAPKAKPVEPATKVPAKPALPVGPPPPVRAPIAVLQVLDKVTAETLKFEAPVGRRIRYKTLVFTVRVCETRGPDDPRPRPSAYVMIDSEAPVLPGAVAPPAKRVFRGWMFAAGPGLHPLEHPIYDAWLVACGAAPPIASTPVAPNLPHT